MGPRSAEGALNPYSPTWGKGTSDQTTLQNTDRSSAPSRALHWVTSPTPAFGQRREGDPELAHLSVDMGPEGLELRHLIMPEERPVLPATTNTKPAGLGWSQGSDIYVYCTLASDYTRGGANALLIRQTPISYVS